MKWSLIYKIGFLVVLVTLYSLKKKVGRLEEKNKLAIENVKAYDSLLDSINGENRVFKLTVEQLGYFNDSILLKMKSALKELKIKEKEVQQLQYQNKVLSKIDTIFVRDTIFPKDFHLDTIVGDKWVSTSLELSYPGEIVINPKVELESFCFIRSKRETINPPKKFFLFRWFQKKQTINTVTIKENNPYVINKEQRYIFIVE